MFSLPTLTWPTKILIASAAGLVLFLAGFRLADNLAEGRAAQAELDLERQIGAMRDAKQRRVDALARDLETERAGRKVRDRIIYKEVQTYGQIVPAARRVTLDGTWRLLHDAAATGDPALATGLAAAEARPVGDAAALNTVAVNYETCRDWRAQLIGWQRYWMEVAAPAE